MAPDTHAAGSALLPNSDLSFKKIQSIYHKILLLLDSNNTNMTLAHSSQIVARLLLYWMTIIATCWTLAFTCIWSFSAAYERYDKNAAKVGLLLGHIVQKSS